MSELSDYRRIVSGPLERKLRGLLVAAHDRAEAAEVLTRSLRADNERMRGALADVESHERDWRKALENMRDSAPPETVDSDDASYWRHQLDALDRILAALSSSPDLVGGDQGSALAESAAVGSLPALPLDQHSDGTCNCDAYCQDLGATGGCRYLNPESPGAEQ